MTLVVWTGETSSGTKRSDVPEIIEIGYRKAGHSCKDRDSKSILAPNGQPCEPHVLLLSGLYPQKQHPKNQICLANSETLDDQVQQLSHTKQKAFKYMILA
jgi:hypothetical protein